MSVVSQAARIVAIMSDAAKDAAKNGDVTGGAWLTPTQCEDVTEAAQEIQRLAETAPAAHADRLAAAHAEAVTLRTDRDQLAAARLQIANVHGALAYLLEEINPDEWAPGSLDRPKAALAESESTWLPLLADIRMLAEHHGNDGDELGQIARRLTAAFGSPTKGDYPK